MKLQPETIELGKKLVEQLQMSEGDDYLSRWIAHDVAAKITTASKPGASPDAHAACAAAIYELWEHRNDLPAQAKPFRDIEQLAETLRVLDPFARRTAYFHERPGPKSDGELWLRHAEAIDSAARTLITHCLEQAAVASGLEAKKWADLADAAGLASPEFGPLRILFGVEERTEVEIRADRLKHLLSVLNDFRRTSQAIGQILKAELASLGPLPKRKRTPDPWEKVRKGPATRPTKIRRGS